MSGFEAVSLNPDLSTNTSLTSYLISISLHPRRDHHRSCCIARHNDQSIRLLLHPLLISMPTFEVPYVSPNPSSWGPPPNDEANPSAPTSKFALLPYAPFGRSDRLGRCADFTGRYSRTPDNYRGNRQRDDNKEFQYKVDSEEQSTFQLVDTSKAATPRRRHVALSRPPPSSSTHGTSSSSQCSSSTIQCPPFNSILKRLDAMPVVVVEEEEAAVEVVDVVWTWCGRGGHGRYQNRIDRQASVSVQPDWNQVEEMDLVKLTKNMTASTDLPTS